MTHMETTCLDRGVVTLNSADDLAVLHLMDTSTFQRFRSSLKHSMNNKFKTSLPIASISSPSFHPNSDLPLPTKPAPPSYSPNPEHRQLIRTASSIICKEILKLPPPSEDVQLRIRSLARLERIWVKASPGTSSQLSSTGLSAAGEERERRLFCEALRDGLVLCQSVSPQYHFLSSQLIQSKGS
jgi:hypothetical protein